MRSRVSVWGQIEDHIHLLCATHPSLAPSQTAQMYKKPDGA